MAESGRELTPAAGSYVLEQREFKTCMKLRDRLSVSDIYTLPGALPRALEREILGESFAQVCDDAQPVEADDVLPGNAEWHVLVSPRQADFVESRQAPIAPVSKSSR